MKLSSKTLLLLLLLKQRRKKVKTNQCLTTKYLKKFWPTNQYWLQRITNDWNIIKVTFVYVKFITQQKAALESKLWRN